MEATTPSYIVDVNTGNFESAVIEASFNAPVMVDFWAPWCNPCKMLMPVVTQLAEEFAGKFILAKVNVDENQDLAMQFNARSVPTVKIFRNGAVVDEFMGAQPEGTIRDILDRHIERDSDKLRTEAQQKIEQGDIDGAIALLQQANQDDPDNPRVRLDLIMAMFLNENYEEVDAAIKALPMAERDTPEIQGLSNRLLFARASAEADDIGTLRDTLETEPNNSEARYQLAAQLVVDGDLEAALGELLILLMRDRAYGDDAARKAMVAILDSSSDTAFSSQWRRKMASAIL